MKLSEILRLVWINLIQNKFKVKLSPCFLFCRLADRRSTADNFGQLLGDRALTRSVVQ